MNRNPFEHDFDEYELANLLAKTLIKKLSEICITTDKDREFVERVIDVVIKIELKKFNEIVQNKI